jgi:Ser/Thr protein kinase RdoA (MazF antagonist)
MTSDSGNNLDDQANQVLTSWNMQADLEPVTIGVNRRVWRSPAGYLTTAWPDERALVEAELAVCQKLADTPAIRFNVPKALPNSNRELIVKAFDRIWWITYPVVGTRPCPTSIDALIGVSVSLAEVHSQLRRVEDVTPVQHRRLVDWAPLAVQFVDDHAALMASAAADTVRRAAYLVDDHREALTNSPQLVHGDPSFPNLLVDPQTNHIVGILDWQEAAVDSVLTDLSVLGNTIWQRSGLPDRRGALEQCLQAYRAADGDSDVELHTVFTAMLAAKLQSVVHHGSRFLVNRGDRANLDEQPGLIAEILQAMET